MKSLEEVIKDCTRFDVNSFIGWMFDGNLDLYCEEESASPEHRLKLLDNGLKNNWLIKDKWTSCFYEVRLNGQIVLLSEPHEGQEHKWFVEPLSTGFVKCELCDARMPLKVYNAKVEFTKATGSGRNGGEQWKQ